MARGSFMTPFGVIRGFCAIDKPSTKFNEDGIYSFNLEFAGKDASLMKKKIDTWMKSNQEEQEADRLAPAPYTVDKDNKTITVKFKLKAKIQSRDGKVYEKAIDVYNAKANKVKKLKRYGEGTELRVNMNVYAWLVAALGAGITLQPNAVQLRKVVEFVPESINEFEALEGYEDATEFTSVDGQLEPSTEEHDEDNEDDDDFGDF